MGIFKAYDVRGIYRKDLDEEISYRIGYFAVSHLKARTVVISRDVRLSSPSLASAVCRGASDAGARCLDIGIASTPVNYFAVVTLGADAGIQVTASHNGPEYNGFKISAREAKPVGYETGLSEIEKLVSGGKPVPVPGGSCEKADVGRQYTKHVLSKAERMKPLRVAIDASNGTAGLFLPQILDGLGVRATPIFFEPDGSFPNHEPNPTKTENLKQLSAGVAAEGADFGVAFDGDADRCVFVDETGRPIRGDMITAILGRDMVAHARGGKVIYDVRSSRSVREEVEKAGGTALRERVGHAFIKARMRKENAILGGEVAGHYYFKENFYVDSADIAMVKFMGVVGRAGGKVSEIVSGVERYPNTGEMNFEVADKDGAIRRVAEEFRDARQDSLDGLTCEYDDWWFNMRKSNTEPLLRLIVEANDEMLLDSGKGRILAAMGVREQLNP